MLQVTVDNVGDVFFHVFCIFQRIFRLVFTEVVQKQTLGEVNLMSSCIRNIHIKIMRIW